MWKRKQIELVTFNTRKAEYLKYNVSDCVPRVRSLGVLIAQKLWLLSLCPIARLYYKQTESKGGLIRHCKVAMSTSVSLSESLWGPGTSCFSSSAKLPSFGQNSLSSPCGGLSSLFPFLLCIFGVPLSLLIHCLAISGSSSVAAPRARLVQLNGRTILRWSEKHSLYIKNAH